MQAVISSDLPEKMERAIHWLDQQNPEGDPLVRLLFRPAFQLTAFWLQSKNADKVLIIDEPDWLTSFSKEKLYSDREFLTLLAPELPAQATPKRPTQIVAPPNISMPSNG